MDLFKTKAKRKRQKFRVPYRLCWIILSLLGLISNVEAYNQAQNLHSTQYLTSFNAQADDPTIQTPPLEFIPIEPYDLSNWKETEEKISPSRSFMLHRRAANLLSPTIEPFLGPPQSVSPYSPDPSIDLIETGSGDGWSKPTSEESLLEDSTNPIGNDREISNLNPTRVLNPSLSTPVMNGIFNKAPILNRRLPKLAITAGHSWRYMLPYDTFLDEEENFRQLKTNVYPKVRKKFNSSQADPNGQQVSINQYDSWLHYDTRSQMFYAFPTAQDVGHYEFTLVVSDKYGETSEETIEIIVRQHQSARAFTHLFMLNRILWNQGKYSTKVDALTEIIRRISNLVYYDSTGTNNMVVQYFESNNVTNEDNSINHDLKLYQNIPDTISGPFFLGWSNSSVPIQPCNMSLLENLLRNLVDERSFSPFQLMNDKLDTLPSKILVEALKPDFEVGGVTVQLQGACEGSNLPQHQSSIEAESRLRVKIKLGKLTWKLGEAIKYQIPKEVFEADRGSSTSRDLYLTLHSIDGSVLDKDPRYNFLEFDQETQTLFGLPYSITDHSGQRELQLTARHPTSGEKVREVFIVNIEPHDLTTINNRAFRMSLYFATRTGIFGPRERVALSHRIMKALKEQPESSQDGIDSQLTVIEIQKFSPLTIPYGQSNLNNFRDKIIKVEDSNTGLQPKDLDGSTLSSVFYKYTWTNESIGYRGDCPVEVVKENVLYALERSMLELDVPEIYYESERSKNDTVRFYERLKLFFEPESDLIHLRFEPLGACVSALELHDVGNGDIADLADRANDYTEEVNNELLTQSDVSITTSKPEIDQGNNDDEYWSIIVLIVLVISLIFVIIMFFMGMNTYKINQEKKFELQIRLAQARQNSMYLSSMMLANPEQTNFLLNQAVSKPTHIIQDDKSSRKPVILDNERRLLKNGHYSSDLKPTAVQLTGQSVHTTTVQPSTTFTLDSIASWKPQETGLNQSSSTLLYHQQPDDKWRAMTLHRGVGHNSTMRVGNQQIGLGNLIHSQSILTVASMAGPLPVMGTSNLPIVYAQLPPNVALNQSPRHFAQPLAQPPQRFAMAQELTPRQHPSRNVFNEEGQSKKLPYQKVQGEIVSNGGAVHNRSRSPSHSSSNSAATQSIISNPNYAPTNH